jgi:hypothetical protein
LIRRLIVLASSVASACYAVAPTPAPSDAAANGAASDASTTPNTPALAIEPPIISAVVDLSVPVSPVHVRIVAANEDGIERDITSEATLTLSDPRIASIDPDGTLHLAGIGGRARLDATWSGASASADLVVELTGALFFGGTTPSVRNAFDGVTTGARTIEGPGLLYPLAGSVFPADIAPPSFEWAVLSDSELYRARLVRDGVIDVQIYTSTRSVTLPSDVWSRIARSAPDLSLTWSVTGSGPSGIVSTRETSLTISADALGQPRLYFHTHVGRLKGLDVSEAAELPVLTDQGPLDQLACTGCHNVSLDGRRIVYSKPSPQPPMSPTILAYGTLRFDPGAAVFAHVLDPMPTAFGALGAFDPSTDAPPALFQAVIDPATDRASLSMIDPDTGAALTDNFADAMASLRASVGEDALMPDWSPDGSRVVFVAFDSSAHPVQTPAQQAFQSALIEARVRYDASTRAFLFEDPQILVPPSADPDTAIWWPTFSPDGSAVAFLERGSSTATIAIVRRSDHHVFELGGAIGAWWNGVPRWSPVQGNRHAWLAFSSKQPYGIHYGRANAVRHIWMAAIDLAALASGDSDPSLPPIYLPGQEVGLAHCRPLWPREARDLR